MTKVFNSLDEFFDEINKSQGFWKDTWYKVYYPSRRALKFIQRIPSQFKWSYQRVRRGYSDRDMWNADIYIAKIISGTLTWMVENSNGVSTLYGTPPNYDDPVEEMAILRDAEYLYYAKIFDEYAKNSIALNDIWQKQIGGISEDDYNDAMKWFVKHFQELWD